MNKDAFVTTYHWPFFFLLVLPMIGCKLLYGFSWSVVE